MCVHDCVCIHKCIRNHNCEDQSGFWNACQIMIQRETKGTVELRTRVGFVTFGHAEEKRRPETFIYVHPNNNGQYKEHPSESVHV